MKVLDQVKDVLQDNTLCVLCTATRGNPHCSLMTYTLGDTLRMVYMVSLRDSRKYKNLLENPNVSLLVDNRQGLRFPSEDRVVSITFEGVFQHLDEDESARVSSRLANAHRELDEILRNPDCVIFGIRLTTFLMLNGPVDSLKGNL